MNNYKPETHSVHTVCEVHFLQLAPKYTEQREQPPTPFDTYPDEVLHCVHLHEPL